MAVTNDWIVANINNPNLDVYDLTTLGGMTTDNTQFKSKQEYLNSNFIKQNSMFQDESGKFSQTKFDSFYDAQAQRWNQLQEDNYPKGLQLDYFSTRRKADSRVKQTQFNIGPAYDPEHGKMGNQDQIKIGILGWDKRGERTKSEAEIAQSQRIFDPSTNSFLNYSPEDFALFESPVKFVKHIFEDPLALAVYEKDEIDQYGIQHRKGEKKLNDQGTYYYEKLDGRSPMNREILSLGDILTKEDSIINHIDFFDSDDLEKSAAGVIAKNVAFVAPMFTPAAPVYYYGLIAKEITRALPMLYEVGTNLFGNESNTPDWLNTLAGKAESFTSSTSVHSKEKVFSFENFANLITDVALQWGQQKQIAEMVHRIGGNPKVLADAKNRAKLLYDSKAGGKLAGLAKVDNSLVAAGIKAEDLWEYTTLGKMCLEKAYLPVKEAMQAKAQFGADLALLYMSIISNTDVYADMKEKGATNKEAAWVTLASTAGMFSVDKYLHIGETFFEGLSDESLIAAKKIAKDEYAQAAKTIYNGTKESPASLWTKGGSLGKRIGEKLGAYWERLKLHDYGSSKWQEGFTKALTEGLEEVSEEFVTDLSKGIYSALGDLGFYDKSVKNPIDWDTAVERYGMSLLGGAVGGGLFYGVELYQNRGYDAQQDSDMADLIRKGKANLLRKEVYELRDKGKSGSTTLSGLDYIKDDNGNVTWLSTDDVNRSQNNIIADRIIDKINAIEATIVGNNANLSDDELFDHMVLSDMRYQQYKNAAYVTGYYDEYKSRLENLLKAESDLKKANLTIDGTPNGEIIKTDQQERHNPNEELKQQRIAKLQEKVDEAKKALDDFLTGDVALDYTRKLNFVLDPALNSVFLDLDYNKFMSEKLGMDVDSIDPNTADPQEIIKAQQEWVKHYKDTMQSDKLDKAYAAYLVVEKSILGPLREQEEISKQYETALKELDELYRLSDDQKDLYHSIDEFKKINKPYKFGDLLPGESEEERAEALAADSPRQFERIHKIGELNRQLYQKYVDQLNEILTKVNYQVDSASARALMLNVRTRIKDIIRQEGSLGWIDSTGATFDPSPYMEIISRLQEDLSNESELRNEITNKFILLLQQKIKDALNNVKSISTTLGNININSKISVDKFEEYITKLDSISESDLEAFSNMFQTPITTKEELIQQFKTLQQAIESIKVQQDVISSISEVTGKAINNKEELFAAYEEYMNSLNDEEKEQMAWLDDDIKQIKDNEYLEELPIIVSAKATNSNLNDVLYSLQEAIQHMLPSVIEESTFSDEFNKFAKHFSNIPISQVIEDLQNPDSEIYKYTIGKGKFGQALLNFLQHPYGSKDVQQFSFGNDTLIGRFIGEASQKETDTISKQKAAVQRYFQETIERIKSNPIFKLFNSLKLELHSPLEEILKQVAVVSLSKDEIIDVNNILEGVYKSFVNADLTDAFILEPTQAKNIESVIAALDMLQSYIYACSTTPDGTHFFGQNRFINDWAKAHKSDLIKDWDPLPEIDDRYAALLNQERAKLRKEASLWRNISEFNQMNKNKRLFKSDEALVKLRYQTLKGLSYKFTVDDHEYDLMEGLTISDSISTDYNEMVSALFDLEQGLYNNFQGILIASKKSVGELLKDGKFFKSFISKPQEVRQQKVTVVSPEMKALTDYDKAIYILTVLTDNPSEFYNQNIIEANDKSSKIAPIPLQQNLSRVGEAATSQQYKEAFKCLANIYNVDKYVAANVVHIDGVAGAGKSEVALKAIKKRFNLKDEDMLVVGPTSSQALKLGKILGSGKIGTFDESSDDIFKALLGDVGKEINEAIDKQRREIVQKDNTEEIIKLKNSNKEYTLESKGKYFDLVYHVSENDYTLKIILHEEQFKFNKDIKQKFIFIDEAAHLNTVQIAILNLFAEQNKGTIFMASDSNQLGYYKDGILENLGPISIFTTRTFKLKESLRTSNIQIQENSDKLSKFINIVEDIFNFGTSVEQKEIKERLPSEIGKITTRVFMDNSNIDGYLLGGKPSEFIPILKNIQDNNKDITIGFIGDSSSSLYQLLKTSGLNVSTPLSPTYQPGKPFMQGQEFDYVIVDSIPTFSEALTSDYESSVGFLKLFYTLATRGKQGSIFIDNFKNILGENVRDSYKSNGYSIQDQLEIFRKRFLDSMESISKKLQLNPKDTKETVKKKTDKKESSKKEDDKEKEAEEKKVEEVTVEEEDDGRVVVKVPEEVAPEYTETPEELQELERKAKAEIHPLDETEDYEEVIPEDTDILGACVEANTVMPVISLPRKVGETYDAWLPFDTSSNPPVRRNLQCFFNTDFIKNQETIENGLITFAEKRKYQDLLHQIQSYLLFGGNAPSSISTYLQIDWSKAKIGVELRKKDKDLDYYGIDSDLTDDFLGGYVLSLVCKIDGVKNADGEGESFQAVFDVCQLTDPVLLNTATRQEEIIKNIDNKVSSITDSINALNAQLETASDDVDKLKSTIQALTIQMAGANKFKEQLPDTAKQYLKWFNEIIQKLETSGESSLFIQLNEKDYILHKTTGLHHRHSDRRLGTVVDIGNIENGHVYTEGTRKGEPITNYDSFIARDSRKIVSPIYILGNASPELKGVVGQSVFGKAVVFVSSNVNIPINDLPTRYLAQKADPVNHTPEVRMVVLDNHGLSFSEIITHRIRDAVSEYTSDSIRLWVNNIMGIKQFTAMWNFRAALFKFKKAYEQWKTDNSLSDETVLNILTAEIEEYQKISKKDFEEGSNISNYLQGHQREIAEVTKKQLELLNEFNQEICKNIPIFRLGLDLTKDSNGYGYGCYVRPFNVKDSEVYDNGEVNLFAIDPRYIEKFYNILDVILDQLTNGREEWKEFMNSDVKPMNTTLTHADGTPFEKYETIGRNEKKRNLSGMIHTQNGIISIDADDYGHQIEIPPEAIFSFFPKALDRICVAAKKRQEHIGETKPGSGIISIGTIKMDDDGKETTDHFNFDIDELFGKDKLDKNNVFDNTLLNLFDFIFHGTVQGLEKWRDLKPGEKLHRAYQYDAPAKFGWFVDPQVYFVPKGTGLEHININGEGGVKNFTLLRCGTSGAFFDVDVDVRPGGVAISLAALLGGLYNESPEVEEVEEEEVITIAPEIRESFGAIGEEGDTLLDAYISFLNRTGKKDSPEALIAFQRPRVKQLLQWYLDNASTIGNDIIIDPVSNPVPYQMYQYYGSIATAIENYLQTLGANTLPITDAGFDISTRQIWFKSGLSRYHLNLNDPDVPYTLDLSYKEGPSTDEGGFNGEGVVLSDRINELLDSIDNLYTDSEFVDTMEEIKEILKDIPNQTDVKSYLESRSDQFNNAIPSDEELPDDALKESRSQLNQELLDFKEKILNDC